MFPLKSLSFFFLFWVSKFVDESAMLRSPAEIDRSSKRETIDIDISLLKNESFFTNLARLELAIGKNLKSSVLQSESLSTPRLFELSKSATSRGIRHYLFIHYILTGVRCTLERRTQAGIVEIRLNTSKSFLSLVLFFFVIKIQSIRYISLIQDEEKGEINEFGRRKDTYEPGGFLFLFPFFCRRTVIPYRCRRSAYSTYP